MSIKYYCNNCGQTTILMQKFDSITCRNPKCGNEIKYVEPPNSFTEEESRAFEKVFMEDDEFIFDYRTINLKKDFENEFNDKILVTVTHAKTKGFSKRGLECLVFVDELFRHIEDYTVPQYGDKGADQCTGFTEAGFITQIKKYANRMERNSRGGQDQLDLLKIAHYCAMLWTKREEEKK